MITVTKIGIVPHMRFFKISDLEDLITNGSFELLKLKICLKHYRNILL